MVAALGIITDTGVKWLDLPATAKFSLTQGHPITNGMEYAYKAYSSTISLPLTKANIELLTYTFLQPLQGKRFLNGLLIYSNTFVYCNITLQSFDRTSIKVKLLSTIFPEFEAFADDENSIPKKAKELGFIELLNLDSSQAPGSNTSNFRYDIREGDSDGYKLPSILFSNLVIVFQDWYGVRVNYDPSFFPLFTRVVSPGWLFGVDAEEGEQGPTVDGYNCWASMPDISPYSLLKAIVLAYGGYIEATSTELVIRSLNDLVATNGAVDASSFFIEAKSMEFSVLKYRKNNILYKGESSPATSIYVDDGSLQREGTWFEIPVTFTGDNNILFTEDLKPKTGVMTIPFLNITTKKGLLDSLAGALSAPTLYEVVFKQCVDGKYIPLDGKPLLVRQLNEILIPTEIVRTSEALYSVKCLKASVSSVLPYMLISPYETVTDWHAKVTIPINISSTSPWSVIVDPNWAALFPDSGTGDDVVNLNVLEAPYGAQRVATLSGTNTQGATTTAIVKQNPKDEEAILAYYPMGDVRGIYISKNNISMYTVPMRRVDSYPFQTGEIDMTRSFASLPVWAVAPSKLLAAESSSDADLALNVYMNIWPTSGATFSCELVRVVSRVPLPAGLWDLSPYEANIVSIHSVATGVYFEEFNTWAMAPPYTAWKMDESLLPNSNYYISYCIKCDLQSSLPTTLIRELIVRQTGYATIDYKLTSI